MSAGFHVLNSSYVPGTVPMAQRPWSHLMPTTILLVHHQFIDEEAGLRGIK